MASPAPTRGVPTCPTEPTQAQRFGKARTAQSGALSEDYVELISDLLANGGEARPTDIARRLGVSHATAIKTIGRLKREGLAVAKPYRGVFLTEAGETAGRARARPPSAWWSICCWRSAFRPRRPSRMPRASSTTSRTPASPRSAGSCAGAPDALRGLRGRRGAALAQRRWRGVFPLQHAAARCSRIRISWRRSRPAAVPATRMTTGAVNWLPLGNAASVRRYCAWQKPSRIAACRSDTSSTSAPAPAGCSTRLRCCCRR